MISFLNLFFDILPIQRIKLLGLILLFVVMSIIEAFSIGIIGPFLNLANRPELITEYSWSNFVYTNLELDSPKNFIALIGILIVILFIVKSLFSWQVKRYLFRVCLNVRRILCEQFLQKYLNAPYIFHLSKDSASIIQTLNGYTRLFSLEVLLPILNLVSNGITIIALSVLLFITSELVIVGLLGMLLPLLLLSYTLKSKIRTWGKRVSNADESIIRTINHSLGGIKETKVIGCFSFFEKELSYHAQEYVNAGTLLYSTQILPRILVECLLIFFLVGSTSILILVGNSIDNFIPVLSIFALSSIRLLPAISNSAKAVNKLRSMSHVVERLNYDIKSIENLKASEKLINRSFQGKGKSHFNNQTIGDRSNNEQGYIILQGITYQYPGTTSASICDISLSIDQGRSIALIGQSGAGKTTLVDTILGLLIPQSGDIKINNYSIYEDLRAWQNKIGYIPQSIFLTADTIERNIAFGVPDHLIDQQRLTKAIEAAQLKEVVENLPEGIQTPVGERGVRLSGGQRQRIGIARALYHEREILVLDEATSALDNETESLVTESIQSLSGTKTMIVIAHRLSTIKHCDRIYVMDKGKIIKSGNYQEVV